MKRVPPNATKIIEPPSIEAAMHLADTVQTDAEHIKYLTCFMTRFELDELGVPDHDDNAEKRWVLPDLLEALERLSKHHEADAKTLDAMLEALAQPGAAVA